MGEKSAAGSTRGLCCQLDTTQTERGRARDIERQRQSGREREGRRQKGAKLREQRENTKDRMIGKILQDRRRRGKDRASEVRRRVTRSYGGGRTSEGETGRR